MIQKSYFWNHLYPKLRTAFTCKHQNFPLYTKIVSIKCFLNHAQYSCVIFTFYNYELMPIRLTCFWGWGWVEGVGPWWVGSFWSSRWHWRSPWGPRGYFLKPRGTPLPGTHTAPPPNVPSVAPVNWRGVVIILPQIIRTCISVYMYSELTILNQNVNCTIFTLITEHFLSPNNHDLHFNVHVQ